MAGYISYKYKEDYVFDITTKLSPLSTKDKSLVEDKLSFLILHGEELSIACASLNIPEINKVMYFFGDQARFILANCFNYKKG